MNASTETARPTNDNGSWQKIEDAGRLLQLLTLGPITWVLLLVGINMASIEVVVWGCVLGPGATAGLGLVVEEGAKTFGRLPSS